MRGRACAGNGDTWIGAHAHAHVQVLREVHTCTVYRYTHSCITLSMHRYIRTRVSLYQYLHLFTYTHDQVSPYESVGTQGDILFLLYKSTLYHILQILIRSIIIILSTRSRFQLTDC